MYLIRGAGGGSCARSFSNFENYSANASTTRSFSYIHCANCASLYLHHHCSFMCVHLKFHILDKQNLHITMFLSADQTITSLNSQANKHLHRVAEWKKRQLLARSGNLGFSVTTPRVTLWEGECCSFILVRTLQHLTLFENIQMIIKPTNKLLNKKKRSDFMVHPSRTTRSLAASDFSVKHQKERNGLKGLHK